MTKLWASFSREFKLLFVIFLCFGIASGIYDTVFNNYLNEVFHISAQVRGFLEFPREFPGFIIAIVSGLLMFLADVRMLGVAMLLISAGMTGQSFYSWGGEPQFAWMVGTMMVWSVGTHLFLPLSSSVTLQLSDKANMGKNLGVLNGAQTAAKIIGCLLIWLVMGVFKLSYDWIFRLAALFALVAMAAAFLMKAEQRHPSERTGFRLLFRKEYSLFYWLSILYGARKQVFLTFAPWVIVRIYNRDAQTMAALTIISAVLGIFFNPWLGRIIDRLGERAVIFGEAICFVGVCLGYAFADRLGIGNYAVYLVFACFIIDLLLASVTMARTTYLHKNLVEGADLTPTLSMGISLDHMVAMTIPMLGGLLWERFGFESIFLVAALISVANMYIAWKIKAHEGRASGLAAAS